MHWSSDKVNVSLKFSCANIGDEEPNNRDKKATLRETNFIYIYVKLKIRAKVMQKPRIINYKIIKKAKNAI